ncbi:hypothetical protein AKJ09_01562 [Labilithrix luteola]|uniref:Outer membrane lipoprotein BamD-like domain-containing protein n=1 Tax=Labilithrix luteola TaxID=1391654 RepID=A0A0K1PMZ3_9BACT|nr:hypothetical protein [Labilithrix luteola]AKU94898.1 hypothetical protein AKJ09_01562 [Labilithrix luteola]
MKRLLLDESVDGELAELLRSAEQDGPRSPEALEQRRNRIFAAMLIVTGAPRALSFVTNHTGLWRMAKWVPLCAVAATIGVTAWTRSTVERKHVDTNAVATSVVAMHPVSPPEPSDVTLPPSQPETMTASVPGIRIDDLPTALPKPTPSAPPRAKQTTAASATTESETSIDAELAAIEAARRVLASGRASEALSRVHDYRATFTNAHFSDEADVIEVQALVALGRTDEAQSKAQRFLAAHPQSAYAKRIRALVTPKE